jgi:RimJ/RimL family protein N-acetyltransferase
MFVRTVIDQDCADLLRWRNDPTTREMAFDQSLVSRHEHVQWFMKKKISDQSIILIGVSGKKKIGMCRFEIDDCDNCAEISINLNPNFRGEGNAVSLLKMGLSIFLREKRRSVFARIKNKNKKSIRLFQALGFGLHVSNSGFLVYLLIPESRMLRFDFVSGAPNQVVKLYELLQQREHNVSHCKVPTFSDHSRFVKSKPYRGWFLVYNASHCIGSVYIKNDNSIALNLKQSNVDFVAQCINHITLNFALNKPVSSYVTDYFTVNVAINNKMLVESLAKVGWLPVQKTMRSS